MSKNWHDAAWDLFGYSLGNEQNHKVVAEALKAIGQRLAAPYGPAGELRVDLRMVHPIEVKLQPDSIPIENTESYSLVVRLMGFI